MRQARIRWLIPAFWYVAVWTALVVVWALQVAPSLVRDGRIEWSKAFALAAINFYSTALVGAPLTVFAWKRGFAQRHVLRSASLYALGIAAASVARFIIFIPLLAIVSGTSYTLVDELRIAFVPQFVGLTTLLAVVLAIRSVRLSEELATARLTALQSQLQPHFLFNTLNAVSMLMHSDADAADEMLSRLCDLLRMTLKIPQKPVVPLDEELAIAMQYVEIMMWRFPGRINVAVDVPVDLRQTPVPPLTLQPLLENVFQHAMNEENQISEVSIRAERSRGRVILRVADNGPGLQETAGTRGGIGVDNTQRRLEAYFGPRARLALENGRAGGTEVTITIPVTGRA